jgi:hypothetical protein
LTDTLIKNNLLLAGILAYNSRIGVFSENEELLKSPVGGIFQQEETMEVSIYNINRRLLMRQERFGMEDVKKPDKVNKKAEVETNIFDKLKAVTSPFYLENENTMEFWAPVVASSGHRTAESLFVENKLLTEKKRIIGFVRITVGKSTLNKSLGTLLVKSVLIGIIFLIAGSGIMYFTIKRIVNPLKKLIESVQTLGKGNFGEKVPVETEDEIGKLAVAFNEMSESLMKREAEKSQLEEQLTQAQKMEAIGTLAGGIAHDFNNILGVVVGYAQTLLLTNPGKAELDHSLKEIFQAGMHANDLVKQILTFSRQGNQKRNPMLIKPIVEEVLKMMRTTLPYNVEIRCNLKAGLSPVLCDPTQIYQVLVNLCTNAGHSMIDGGGVLEVKLDEVKIDAEHTELSIDIQPGRYQIMTVTDTGHGMDYAIRKRIYDPFFTTKAPGMGTGMGLSVVHGIVKSHGGKINCYSELGKGTTFEVFFPTIREESLEVS